MAKRRRIESKDGGEPLILLSEAIRILKADPATAWMPPTSIRNAVASGKVPSMRTPAGKWSRYFVRLSDIKALFKETPVVSS
jgi:hypothetical protein